jgi:hypothetical protein
VQSLELLACGIVINVGIVDLESGKDGVLEAHVNAHHVNVDGV